MDDMEYSPNAESVKRELASRVRTGKGRTRLVREMDEISYKAAFAASSEDEWPEATDDAQMVIWRVRGNEVPSGKPTEVWWFSGNVDRPVIREVSERLIPKQKGRVPDDVLARRLAMGWDEERATTTPLAARAGSIRAPDHPGFGMMNVDGEERKVTMGLELFTAFGMSKTIAEWSSLTRVSEGALRLGARKHGMEEYLRKKHWYPGGRA
jgi:hypothetical protein